MNISDSCNYVNIKTNNSEEILMNIENELPIVIFPKAGKLIFSVNSPPFNMNIFKQFKNVFFYIEYPSKKFDLIYDQIKKLKKRIKRIKIEIYISKLEANNMIFRNDENINSIILGDSVKEIQGGAFFEVGSFGGCSSLENIEMTSSIKSIGCFSLYKCISLKKINIPSSVKSIGLCAFYECSSLEKIELPPSVKKIQNSTFYDCKSLKIIKIPNSVNYIGESTFAGCSSLVEIVIPSLVTKIEEKTFSECSSLKKIKFLGSIEFIESYAFYLCKSLVEINFPSSLIEIKNQAFYGCSSLAFVRIPSFTTVADNSFEGCSSLKKNMDFLVSGVD